MNTTHRCSIAISDNDFVTDQPDGYIYHTYLSRPLSPAQTAPEYVTEIKFHRENGHSLNCVICKDEAKPDNATLLARLQQLDAELADNPPMNEATLAACDEIIDIRNRLDLDGAGDYAFGRELVRNGAL